MRLDRSREDDNDPHFTYVWNTLIVFLFVAILAFLIGLAAELWLQM